MIFPEIVEYNTEDLVSNFRSGVLYSYIGSSFLEGYINHIKPIKAYLLERYRTQGPKFEEKWNNMEFKFHTKLSDLDDDVLILGETGKHYYFFWFDCDVSDCSIGRQGKLNILKEDMIKWFDEYVNDLIETEYLEYRNIHREELEKTDEFSEAITGYREIPLEFFKGCIRF